MSGEPLEEAYFNWLYSKVAYVEVPTPSLSYHKLLQELYNTEFVWLLSGDDNRAEDGVDLRSEFLQQSGMTSDPDWECIGCSVLEMLIAFSRKASFQTGDTPRDWFWIFLHNLELDALSDNKHAIKRTTKDILDIFIWRTYDYNGLGGLFPLENPEEDQRKVEIWYQFCAYLYDQGL